MCVYIYFFIFIYNNIYSLKYIDQCWKVLKTLKWWPNTALISYIILIRAVKLLLFLFNYLHDVLSN